MASAPREHWAEIEPILDQALDLPSSDRRAFLDRACSNDSALRARVERLLHAAENATDFLDVPALVYAAPLLPPEAQRRVPTPGERLGAYELVRELGHGGMGTVFLARDHKHDREVALKVLHPGLAAMLGTERFSQEIRISAKLDHPHILTLIDSGESDGLVWYVLPYVRGESLRDRLVRERPLSLGAAVRIASQVASALEYAHSRGVIHRDIKPENILLHEGEAVVADFGIALAVKEAGGQRLNDSGVRLGTPRYMSPEQARGGGELDARTDVYSLGAVVYEMLSGEPPHAAETAEVVVSKRMHDEPARLRLSSDAIPESVDAAVMKALATAPADRFDSATDFARALAGARDGPSSGRIGRRALFLTAVGMGVLVLAAAVRLWMVPTGRAGSGLVVHERTQLTFTGNASAPAISADGRKLAYVVRRCDGASCTFGIEIQDVGGGSTRRILDRATALYGLGWSPDGRYMEFNGTIATRFGAYVMSTLGGKPRLVVSAPGAGVSFLPRGDSLLVTMPLGTDSIGWLRVTTLDGAVQDSIPIERPGSGLSAATMLAGGRWIVVAAQAQGRTEWRIVDRHGHQRDVFPVSDGATPWLSSRVTGDALWLLLSAVPPSSQRPLVRLSIDGRAGRFTGGPDTVLYTSQQLFDVTNDGTSIVYGDGTYQYDAWVLGLRDALLGRFVPERRLLSSTSSIDAVVSPDGERVLLVDSRGSISVVPYGAGARLSHQSAGTVVRCVGWMPGGGSFRYAERVADLVRLVSVDARTGVRQSVLPTADSSVVDCEPVAGGGWVWIPQTKKLRVQQSGERQPRDLPVPAGYRLIFSIGGRPDRSQFVVVGFNATGDSVPIDVVSLPDGHVTRWATLFGEAGNAYWLADGSLMLVTWETAETATLYRARSPGNVERVGTIPLPVEPYGRIALSHDGRRVSVVTKQFRGDIWLAKVTSAR